MADSTALLRDSVSRILADVVTPQGTLSAESVGIDDDAWSGLRDIGLTGDDAGRLGINEHSAVVECIGYSGALVPYAESEGLARWLALEAGHATASSETLALAIVEPRNVSARENGWAIVLRQQAIPWASQSDRILLSFSVGDEHFVAIAPRTDFVLHKESNLAGEPNDRCANDPLIVAPCAVRTVNSALGPENVYLRGALLRAAAMVGALTKANELTHQYASDRHQFGKSLSRFPVLQSYLAAMAGELCAASTITHTAAEAATADLPGSRLEIAAAKVRVGQAARVIASHAHQIHGAMGITQEYPLQLSTRRLWAWREDYGNEAHWSDVLGSGVITLGPEPFWERITDG